jgi:hypothetical protein
MLLVVVGFLILSVGSTAVGLFQKKKQIEPLVE